MQQMQGEEGQEGPLVEKYVVSIAAKNMYSGSIATKVLFVEAESFKDACQMVSVYSTQVEYPTEDNWVGHCMSLKRIDTAFVLI